MLLRSWEGLRYGDHSELRSESDTASDAGEAGISASSAVTAGAADPEVSVAVGSLTESNLKKLLRLNIQIYFVGHTSNGALLPVLQQRSRLSKLGLRAARRFPSPIREGRSSSNLSPRSAGGSGVAGELVVSSGTMTGAAAAVAADALPTMMAIIKSLSKQLEKTRRCFKVSEKKGRDGSLVSQVTARCRSQRKWPNRGASAGISH